MIDVSFSMSPCVVSGPTTHLTLSHSHRFSSFLHMSPYRIFVIGRGAIECRRTELLDFAAFGLTHALPKRGSDRMLLSLQLRKQPAHVVAYLLGLFTIILAHATISDVSPYLTFFPSYKHVFQVTSQYTTYMAYAFQPCPADHFNTNSNLGDARDILHGEASCHSSTHSRQLLSNHPNLPNFRPKSHLTSHQRQDRVGELIYPFDQS